MGSVFLSVFFFGVMLGGMYIYLGGMGVGIQGGVLVYGQVGCYFVFYEFIVVDVGFCDLVVVVIVYVYVSEQL